MGLLLSIPLKIFTVFSIHIDTDLPRIYVILVTRTPDK